MGSDKLVSQKIKSEGITDLSLLERLSGGDDMFVKTIIKVFLEENPLEIEQLEEGVKNKDFKLIGTTAHKLKSSVPYLGLSTVIENKIIEIEKLASANEDILKIESLFCDVKNVCEKAREELTPVYN